jgi:hypothetical protein
VELGSHVAAFLSLWPDLIVETGGTGGGITVVVRPAFDDAKYYLRLEVVAVTNDGTSTTRIKTRAVSLADSTIGSLPTLNLTDPSTLGSATDAPTWERLIDNADRETQLYRREHDWLTGAHKVPLQRLTGHSEFFSGAVTAPGTVGTRSTVTLAALPAAHRPFFPPAMVGAAGSGIVACSLAFDDANVYLQLQRITAGTTNSFTAKVHTADEA